MDQHFVCPACGGQSNHEKSCETAGCALQSQPLIECTCEDGHHAEVKAEEEMI